MFNIKATYVKLFDITQDFYLKTDTVMYVNQHKSTNYT